ncbi:unnamed protein product [Mytilus coruscus]|uniref:C2H2-type domain-containing protein n=1 Tax=Mytilus coruscus TaxID=42192 RepID=A0A6J8DI80_MYTCO|nr:unnamed protein product [Mytilus coruscus]
MDYEKGRVYKCTKCCFVGEKRAAIKHYASKHFGVDEHMFSCELCNFSTDNKQLMKRHPSFYTPHSTFCHCTGNIPGQRRPYFKVNPTPQQVDPELHLSKWEQEASVLFWITKRKPKPSAAAGSAPQPISSINLPVLQSALTSFFETNPIYNPSPLNLPVVPSAIELLPTCAMFTEAEVSTEFVDTRVVVAEESNLADHIIHLSDPPAMPSPLCVQ